MPDNIVFDTIPGNQREGGIFIEIDTSHAVDGLAQMERKLLLIAQKLPAGTAPANTPIRFTSENIAKGLFGQGSMLALMAAGTEAVKKRYGAVDTWAIALDDNAAGVVATGSFAITGTVTRSNTLTVYIGGEPIQAAATLNDTAPMLATKLAAAINANVDLPVTADATTNTVTITCRHKGLCGNGIELSTSYYQEDALPAGITIAVTAMSGGAGNPDVIAALAAISEDWFYSICCPYTDSANLAKLEADLDGRWGGMNMKTGHIFNAYDGTHSELTTFGSGRNSAHVSTWGLKACPTWAPVRAAAWSAVCEYHGAIDPALPLRNLVVPGVKAPRLKDRFSYPERNLLLFDGISTTTVDAGGNVVLSRTITNYQKSTNGADDESLLRLETKWTVDYLRYDIKQLIALTYPRHKLVDDDTNIDPGQKYFRPKDGFALIYARSALWEKAGLIEDRAQLKRDLRVVRSLTDKDRVNAIIPPNLVNQFNTFAAAVQYRL